MLTNWITSYGKTATFIDPSNMSSRLWSQLVRTLMILVLYHVICISGNLVQRSPAVLDASSRSSASYYAEMWYRTWQFPLIIGVKWIAILAFLFFSFGTTAIQGLGYHRSEPESQQPLVIDGNVESYGNPWFQSWGK
ncbi:uncharacterized protein LOC129767113 [Toxorhynchites rutilus septentrionalis]|uniref:uncharacterized protein LOC129767113 n=1 Tax=Toxorhynchites rutilus septentrionalis TaxID=329112 RepID=UPI00247A5E5E|nr:uncharacterized protein LOC129767113 [Toxorhynchites rutilus septentrionalis]